MDKKTKKDGLIAAMRPFLPGRIRSDGGYEPPDMTSEINPVYGELHAEYLRDLVRAAQHSRCDDTASYKTFNVGQSQPIVCKPNDIQYHGKKAGRKLGPEGTHLVNLDGSYMEESVCKFDDSDEAQRPEATLTSENFAQQGVRAPVGLSESEAIGRSEDDAKATEVGCVSNEGQSPKRPTTREEFNPTPPPTRPGGSCCRSRTMGENTIGLFAQELEKVLMEPDATGSN